MKEQIARFDVVCVSCGQIIKAGTPKKWSRWTKDENGKSVAGSGLNYHPACHDKLNYPIGIQENEPESFIEQVANGANPTIEQLNENAKDLGKPSWFDSMVKDIESKVTPKIDISKELEKIEDRIESFEKDATDSIQAIANSLEEKLKTFKPEIPSLEIKTVDNTVVKFDLCHKQTPLLINLLNNGHIVYVYSEIAGLGKSEAGLQAAIALARQAYAKSFSPATPESEIFGYYNPVSQKYVDSALKTAFETGGLYIGEEFDCLAASQQTKMNYLMSQKKYCFPNEQELKSAHPEFRMMLTGNTNGQGANPFYPERRCFDKAFFSRMILLKWERDETLERTICEGLLPSKGSKLYDLYLESFAIATKKGFMLTTREVYDLCKLIAQGFLKSLSFATLLDMTVFRLCGSFDCPLKSRGEVA